MRKTLTLTATIFAILIFGALTFATTVPLTTGYDKWAATLYPIGARDDYWTVMNTFPNPNINAWVHANTGLPPQFPGSNWINAWNTTISAPGVSATYPGYAIFRECFCLEPGFQNPVMNFTAQGDDVLSMWINGTTLSNIIVPPTPFGSTATVNKTTGFRVGANCIYALIEDYHGRTGFDLKGDMSAIGLLQYPAKGPNQVPSFGQCNCPTGNDHIPNGPTSLQTKQAAGVDFDKAVIQEIMKYAEIRKAERLKALPRN
jgi:hypothetical protein